MLKFINENIENYSIQMSNRPSAIADELELYTKEHVDMSQMLVGKLEASLLGFLIKCSNTKKIFEFGTYTGYSALTMAENLPDDGVIHTVDINSDTVDAGKLIWSKSESSKKIISHIGQGLDVINSMNEKFDLIFIDADKTNYLNYLQAGLDKLSLNGMIVIDNVLWSGKVLEENQDQSTEAIKEINSYIANNDDLYGTLLPVRDGMFLVRRNR